jgi:thiamine biosynthesis lipoprotein
MDAIDTTSEGRPWRFLYDRPVKLGGLSSLLVTLAVLGVPLVPAVADRPASTSRFEASRLSMACVYDIVAYGDASVPTAIDQALDEVDRIDRLMSHYKHDSPLSQLNRSAADGPVGVDPELFDFIVDCLAYSRDSGGAFDVTVGPLMKAWGFFQGEGRLPGDREISELRTRIGYDHVVVDVEHRTVRFDVPGVEIDLGGIAKGYAVDRAVGVLKRHGVAAALASAGGSTIYGLGSPPGRRGWDVTLQDPTDSRKVALRVRLRDRALSVSGSSEKSFEMGGVRYSHIMDPRTGRPAQGVLSVAVLTSNGTRGDALDDAFYVEGVERTREHLRRLPGTEAFFFLPEGRGGWRVVRLPG